MKKPLYLVLGKSGSGKDTIVDAVCDILGKTKVKSFTTRKRRNETENTHIFTDETTFKQLDIVAKTRYNNNYYGATQSQIDHADFYIVDPAGIKYFRQHNRTPRKIYIVYIACPKSIRIKHMTARQDEFAAQARIKTDETMFKDVETMHHDVTIPNLGELKYAVDALLKFISKKEGIQCESAINTDSTQL